MRAERGSATIEFLLGLLAFFFPMMGLVAATTWPERMNAARAAAYEAAKAVVSADDPSAAGDLGRQRAMEVIANHGFSTGAVEVTYSATDLRRGDLLTATVTVRLPAIAFPGIGYWDSIGRSESSTQRVADFKSFR